MEELYNTNLLADVLFIIKDQKIYAHSFILIIHSSVFRERFDGTFNELKVIPITFTTTPIKFLQFLKYFYYQRCELTSDNVIEIVKLAIKYKVNTLEQMCYEFVWSKKFYSDSLKFYEIFKKENLKFLRDIQLTKIAYDFDTFLCSDKFLKISRDTLDDVLRMNCVWGKKTNEMLVFERVVKWAEHNKNLSGKNEKMLLGNLIKLIRFPTMRLNDFLDCVSNNANIFECDQICEIISYITLKSDCVSFVSTPRTIHTQDMCVSQISAVKLHSTKFNVSHRLLIYGVWIQSPIVKQKCTIILKNQYDTILTEITLCTLYEYFCSPIRFNEDIELNSNDEYTVTVYYDNPTANTFLWSHLHDIETVDNIIVNYSAQSRLITKVIFDVL